MAPSLAIDIGGGPGNRYRQSPGAAGSAIDIGCMASGLISMPSRVHAPDPISAEPAPIRPSDIAGCWGSPVPGGVRSRCCTRVPDGPDRTGRGGTPVHRIPEPRHRRDRDHGRTGSPKPDGTTINADKPDQQHSSHPTPSSKHHEISDGTQPMACRYQHGRWKTQNLA